MTQASISIDVEANDEGPLETFAIPGRAGKFIDQEALQFCEEAVSPIHNGISKDRFPRVFKAIHRRINGDGIAGHFRVGLIINDTLFDIRSEINHDIIRNELKAEQDHGAGET
jgi:hypothetical protein